MTLEAAPPMLRPATEPAAPEAHVTEIATSPSSPTLTAVIGAYARPLRRSRISLPKLSLFVLVIAPTLATLFYALFWAAPQYQSEFRFSVRAAERMQASSLLTGMLGLGTSLSASDSNAVVQYILSHEMLEELPPEIDFDAIYDHAGIDRFWRLKANASPEEKLRYWKDMTEAYYETSTETVVVKLTAFSPDDALKLAKRTLTLSESVVNRMSARSREDSVKIAKRQVDSAEQRLTELREKIKNLREKESLLDPRKEAETDLTLEAKLREDLSRANANLDVMRRSMNDNAPAVVAARNRISALETELARLTSATVKQDDMNRPLTSVFGAFEQLESERSFAEKSYQTALASLQSAELDASRQQLYLATIVKPNLPQEPDYPRPLKMTLLVFVLTFAFWALANLAVASVRDHR